MADASSEKIQKAYEKAQKAAEEDLRIRIIDTEQRAWRYKDAQKLREEAREKFDKLIEMMTCSVCGGLTSVKEVDSRLRALKRLIGGLKGLKWKRMEELLDVRRFSLHVCLCACMCMI